MRFSDHQILDQLHNKFVGRRCFIIGTGPSLLKVNRKLIAQLANEVTFGLNYLLQVPDWPFMPDFCCASEVDELAKISACVDEGVKAHGVEPKLRIFSNIYPPHLHERELENKWLWIYRDHAKSMQEGEFGGLNAPFDWAADGSGVLFDCAVPAAAWMGFNPIYLLGCDATREGHAHPDGTEARQRGTRGRQDTVQRCALAAFNRLRGRDRELLDCTEGGTLPITKVHLKDVLKS